MYLTKQIGCCAILLAFFASTLTAVGQDLDRIYTKAKGIPDRGTVVKMSPQAVTLNNAGIPKEYKVNEIRQVTYGDDPDELESGRRAALAGQYEQAMESLGEIDVNTISRKVVREDVEFFRAYAGAKLALTGGGSEADKEKARDALIGFARNNSGSFHFYEAARILGDLEASLGNYAQAAKYYTSLGSAPFPEYRLEAALLSADAYVGAGQLDEAKKRYQFVVDDKTGGLEVAELRSLATVGLARCKAGSDPGSAIAELQKIIKNGDAADAKLFGKAYNALGNCYLAESKTQDALLAFLHTHVLFYTDAEIHAESLYHLSKLWADVNQADRAVEARNLLKRRYGSTSWASKQ